MFKLRRINRLLSGLINCSKLLGLPESDIKEASEYLNNFEAPLCFDQIITQLYEYDIEIIPEFYELVEESAKELDILPGKFSFLLELIRNENTVPKLVQLEIDRIIAGLLKKAS